VSVTIEYSRRASNTDAFVILAEAWNEMVQEGITPDYLGAPPIRPDTEVLYATSKDGDIVGVLAWRHDPTQEAYVVSIGYVEPSSRKQGVFRQLYEALKQRAYRNGVPKIVSEVYARGPGAEVFRRLGATQVSITYEHRVS
jgi:Acetyltransferase (GNAT) family.